jgi:hypothetical protein
VNNVFEITTITLIYRLIFIISNFFTHLFS